MSARPWMPVYIGDYLRDTVGLTTQEHGAYLLLLFAMWSSDDGTLENDREKLRRITGVSRNQWKAVFAAIAPRLLPEGDRITQKRLQAELGKAKAKTLIRRAAGRLGAEITNSRFKVFASNPGYGVLNSSPKRLTNNNAATAKADHLPRTTTTTEENNKSEALPLPRMGEGEASRDNQRAPKREERPKGFQDGASGDDGRERQARAGIKAARSHARQKPERVMTANAGVAD